MQVTERSNSRRTHRVLGSALAVLLSVVAAGVAPDRALASPRVIHVTPGESIQDAVDRARPGERIVVRPGTYRETVTVRTDRIALQGFGATLQPPDVPDPDCNGNAAVAFGICIAGERDAQGELIDPVEGVSISGFTVTGYTSSGILVSGGLRTRVSRTRLTHNGTYGILSVRSTKTFISDNWTTGNDESGYYVGSSPDAHATLVNNVSVDDGVLGFFIRNASHGVVKGNRASGNCVGIGLFDIPAGALPPQTSDWDVRFNYVADNTRFCADDPPLSGTGILLSGALDSIVHGNVVTGNEPAAGQDSPLAGGIVAAPAGTFGSRPAANDLITHNFLRGNAPYDLVEVPGAGENIRFVRNLCWTSSPLGLCHR